MTPESIRFLYEYHYWASDRMWDCIQRLTDAQFIEPIDFSMGEIRNHVVHVMSGTRRWIERLQDKSVSSHLTFADYPTRDSVKLKWDELKAETLAYINSLDEDQLDRLIRWDLPQRGVSSTSHRWQVLLHVVNHATDHRAQVLTLLHTHFHVETVEQDMITFLASEGRDLAAHSL
jgi:uncharacterized damage-inducible protein DinB